MKDHENQSGKEALTNVFFTKEMGQIVPSTDPISTILEESDRPSILGWSRQTYQCRGEHRLRSLLPAAFHYNCSVFGQGPRKLLGF